MRRAIVLAGGLGTRLGPAFAGVAKALVPIGAAPLVVHQVRRLVGVGVADIALATGHLAEQVETALGDGATWDARLTYSVEQEPRGTGGALALAARHVDADDTVVVVNGDLLSRHDLGAQIDAFERSGAQVMIHVREVDDPRAFGVVLVDDDDRVAGFLEKPDDPPSRLVNAGTYVFRGAALLELPDTIPLSLERDVFPRLAERGVVRAHRDDADFVDVGTPEAVIRATREWR